TQRGSDRACSLECERHVQFIRTHECTGRTPKQHSLNTFSRENATRQINQFPKCAAKRNFIQSGTHHVPGNAKQLGACEADSTLQDDEWYIHECLDIIDNSWFPKQTNVDRKRRFIPRLATFTFNRIEQRGFFAADVGAGAPPKFHVE